MWSEKRVPEELYDLEKGPHETVNLAAGGQGVSPMMATPAQNRRTLVIRENMKLVFGVAWLAVLSAFPLHAAQLGSRDATIWLYEEWSLDNSSCEGNPFDVVARVKFSHDESGETRTTEMFYAGDGTWKFRFTATRSGRWDFETAGTDPELNGHSGAVTVRPNPNSKIKGFLTHKGNRFAVPLGDGGRLAAYRFNVYMSRRRFTGTIIGLPEKPDDFRSYLDDAGKHGFDTVFVHVVNNWFRYGALKHSEHDSQNPDPKTFEVLEEAITAAHRRGCRVHIWAWGDESRKWTPIGVGGINGPADRRLQRYIAARLGPLPGWSMGYGFDLHEWTKGPQLDRWSEFLHERMGWDHLLCARGHKLPQRANNINSYDGFGRGVQLTTTAHGPKDYREIVDDLQSDRARPHFYEERHSYLRDGFKLDMDGTRRLLWWQTMAGGMGGFYGFYPDSPHPYPNPEQLRCIRDFWRKRFLLEMVRASGLTDGFCLKTPDDTRYVFYREKTDSVGANLSAARSPLRAVAVDTTKEYREIDLGLLRPADQTIRLPATSDWAVAVGRY